MLLALGQTAPTSIPAMVAPLPKVLAVVSNKSGLKLKVSAALTSETLGIGTPPLPTQEILDHIAKATEATWTKDADGMTLSRTPEQVAARRARELAEHLKQVRNTQAAAAQFALKPIGGKVRVEVHPGDFQELSGPSAFDRFANQVFARLDATELAKMPAGSRKVFSNAPNRAQLPLRLDLKKELELLYADVPSLRKRPAEKILIVVQTSHFFGWGVNVTATFVSEWGRVLGSGSPYWELTEPEPLTLQLPKYPLTITADSREAYRLEPLSPKAAWLRPTERDPLSTVHLEAIETVLAQMQKPVAIALPDSVGFVKPPDKLTLAQWATDVQRNVVLTDDAWLTGVPKLPMEADGTRLSRPALARLLAHFQKDGVVRLDSIAEFIAASSMPLGELVIQSLTAIQGMQEYYFDGAFWLRLYGSLTKAQREQLASGQTMTFDSFSPRQRAILASWFDSPQYASGVSEFTRPHPSDQRDPSYQGQRIWHIEPTEAFPNGLPLGLTFSARVKAEESYFEESTKGMKAANRLNAASAAGRLFAEERPEFFPWITEATPMGPIRTGTATDWDFTLKLADWYVVEGALSDAAVSGKSMKYSETDPAFRQEVQRKLEQMRRQYRDMVPPKRDPPPSAP